MRVGCGGSPVRTAAVVGTGDRRQKAGGIAEGERGTGGINKPGHPQAGKGVRDVATATTKGAQQGLSPAGLLPALRQPSRTPPHTAGW
jgi:hypothetical protein